MRRLKHMKSIPLFKPGADKTVAIAMKVTGVNKRVWKKRLKRELELTGWSCTFHKDKATGALVANTVFQEVSHA